MASELNPGSAVALRALAEISAMPFADLVEEFAALTASGSTAPASSDQTQAAARELDRRVRLSPAIDFERREQLVTSLATLIVDPPSVPTADIDAWWTLARRLPDGIATLAVPPVELPVMDAPQGAAWHTLMDLEEQLDEPWVLVGGQMTMLHCLEHGIDAFRPTDDGDVVLGVWTRRQALPGQSSSCSPAVLPSPRRATASPTAMSGTGQSSTSCCPKGWNDSDDNPR